jgi:hypothetical protein
MKLQLCPNPFAFNFIKRLGGKLSEEEFVEIKNKILKFIEKDWPEVNNLIPKLTGIPWGEEDIVLYIAPENFPTGGRHYPLMIRYREDFDKFLVILFHELAHRNFRHGNIKWIEETEEPKVHSIAIKVFKKLYGEKRLKKIESNLSEKEKIFWAKAKELNS